MDLKKKKGKKKVLNKGIMASIYSAATIHYITIVTDYYTTAALIFWGVSKSGVLSGGIQSRSSAFLHSPLI